MTKHQSTLCFFGIYDRNYTRNRILIKGLSAEGIRIIHCNVDPARQHGISRYISLLKEALRIRYQKPEAILVAYPGQTVMWLARLVFPMTPIVFDAFVSLYDTNVYDRQAYTPRSLRGIRDYLLDWYSIRFADVNLLDTNEHISYFIKTFKTNKRKCIRVPVGSDEDVFFPRPRPQFAKEKFVVYFHGTFIPLHGIEYIVDAAEILKKQHVDINFFILGAGQVSGTITNLIRARQLEDVVTIHAKVPFERLPDYIAKADVCLGIFGKSNKVLRVVPNKVFEYIAMRKPVITADTPAIREFLTDGHDVIFCKQANSESLAERIIFLKNNPDKAMMISQNGAELFGRRFTSSHVAKGMLMELRSRSIISNPA